MGFVSLTSPGRMLRFGLLVFALGTSARLFLHPAAPGWGDAIDAAAGFGTGVLLAAFLLSARRRSACPRS